MRTLIIAALVAAAGASAAEDWTIDQKTRDECAKEGGCILTIPDGHLVRLKDVQDGLRQIAEAAYQQGAVQGFEAGAKTCKRQDI